MRKIQNPEIAVPLEKAEELIRQYSWLVNTLITTSRGNLAIEELIVVPAKRLEHFVNNYVNEFRAYLSAKDALAWNQFQSENYNVVVMYKTYREFGLHNTLNEVLSLSGLPIVKSS